MLVDKQTAQAAKKLKQFMNEDTYKAFALAEKLKPDVAKRVLLSLILNYNHNNQ